MIKWIPLLALLTAFPPLSTDMYLPAIPSLAQQWQRPLWVINLTLSCFFITYSFFLLLYGPVSDRFGRRPLLKIGITIYVLASLMCALAPNAGSLIAFRILQAAGGACASALALAICSDVFSIREREKVLAYIGVVTALCPMISPVIGGWVLAFLSWPWVFVILAGLGTVALIGVHRMKETLPSSSRIKKIAIGRNYIELTRNRPYFFLALLVSISFMPLFAFIAASSDIYINGFGVSEQMYGYFFGFNALALMLGALFCTRLNQVISSKNILFMSFAGITAGGIWLLAAPLSTALDFALPMLVITFCIGISRPPSFSLVLGQVDKGVGAASSLLTFFFMSSGAAAMWFVSLGWQDRIQVLGVMGLICGGTALFCWALLRRVVRTE